LSSGFYGNVRDSNHREEKGDIFAPKWVNEEKFQAFFLGLFHNDHSLENIGWWIVRQLVKNELVRIWNYLEKDESRYYTWNYCKNRGSPRITLFRSADMPVSLLTDHLRCVARNSDYQTTEAVCFLLHKKKQKQTPWSESASELYRPSDRRLSST
jgi:hypothetical protein